MLRRKCYAAPQNRLIVAVFGYFLAETLRTPAKSSAYGRSAERGGEPQPAHHERRVEDQLGAVVVQRV